MKISKQKILICTTIFALLLVLGICTTNIAIVRATDPSAKDQTLQVLTNALGIDTQAYDISVNSQSNDQYRDLLQSKADLYLESSHGSVRVSSSFINNNLQLLYFSDNTGNFSVKQPAKNTVASAKDFLERYANLIRDSFYAELSTMLNGVDITTNTTKSITNINLKVINSEDIIIDYIWTYTDANGIRAEPKNVILSYNQGQLQMFSNNWPMYKIINTPVISAQEATEIAIKATQNYSYEATTADNKTITVTGFIIAPKSLGHATLSYQNSPNQTIARDNDPFTLYPSWYVPLGFDKYYPGKVTGMVFSIWADTGTIYSMGPMVCENDLDNSASTSTNTINNQELNYASTTYIPIALLALCTTGSILSIHRIQKIKQNRVFKPKLFGLFLCITLLLGTGLMALPKAGASACSKSEIYACINTPDGFSEPAKSYEADACNWTCNQIENYFSAAGYNTTNLAGPGTQAADVISQADYDEQHFAQTAVFHVGHKAIGGYQDDDGDLISAEILWSKTTLYRHFFAFIWVCSQAGSETFGMPIAWTHRNDTQVHPYMSSNGYVNPDNGGQCFIGFTGLSPIISGYHQTFANWSTDGCKDFIDDFYDFALNDHYSVNNALNLASWEFFTVTYTASPLYGEDGTGYQSWYPTWGNYSDGYMRVFGDGNIYLYQQQVTLAADNSHGGGPLSANFRVDGCSVGSDSAYLPTRYQHLSVDNPNPSSYQFWRFGEGTYWQNPIYIYPSSGQTYSAHFTDQYLLEINGSPLGYTNYGNGFKDRNTWLHITATPYNSSAYEFDHWEYSWYYWNSGGTKIEVSGSSSSETLDLYMDRNYEVTPCFAAITPPPTHEIYLQAYDFTFCDQICPAVYVDGDYAGNAWSTIYISEGYHDIYFETPVWNDNEYRYAYFGWMGYMG
jgi:hypothetical protein